MFNLFEEICKARPGFEASGISFKQEAIKKSGQRGMAEDGEEGGFELEIAKKIKAGLEKEMKKKHEKRAAENSEMVAKTRELISETVAAMNFEEITDKYSELINKVGSCILSANNFVEALKDEDCLCLTFDLGRSLASIADPSQILIKDIFPSLLSAGSFFLSTEYALKKNSLAHGGFEKHKEGIILKGAANENITGVLPLYICDEHWKVAKKLMRMTLGWNVTLEPAGYTYQQMKIVPFMILAELTKMVDKKPESEFLKFQFKLVEETCAKILEEDKEF
jgi:hypothetical protein